MLDDLDPDTVVWVGPTPDADLHPAARHLDAAAAAAGALHVDGERRDAPETSGELGGFDRSGSDIAG